MTIRATLFFGVTTNPNDRNAASPHSGGWSESIYLIGNAFADIGFLMQWANTRATLLAGECSVIGYRQQMFTVTGNKMLPGGAGSGTLNYPGNYPNDLDVPQASLMCNLQVATQPQTIRQRLAGMPDSMVTYGEYQPTDAYKGSVTKYLNFLSNKLALAFTIGAVTHDLTQPSVRLLSINPVAGATTATVITDAPTGTIPGGWIRFHRVRDVAGLPVSGSFVVTQTAALANGQQTYTIAGYLSGQTVVAPNGLARNDVLVINPLMSGKPNRVVVRKVGRPFVQYRGRRSKRRTM